MVNDSEQLPHIIESPEFVITLVHGTFAPNAGWTREGSQFRQMLMEKIGPNVRVHFEEFKWIGFFGTRLNNSHTHRLAAGESLRRRLSEVQASFPYSHHFIVSHSHGGNVALYALRDESVRRRLSGLVCLATPFLQPKGRDYTAMAEALETYVPICLAAIAWFAWAALTGVLFFLLQFPFNWLSSHTAGSLHTIFLVVPIVSLPLGILADVFLYRVALDFVEDICDLSELRSRQEDALSRLSLPEVTPTFLPLFCAHISGGDEASWGLSFVRSFVDLPSYVSHFYIKTLAPLIFVSFCILLLGGSFIGGCGYGISITEIPSVQKFFGLLLFLFFLGPAIIFCFNAIASSNFNLLRLLGFGSEATMDSLLVQLEVKSSINGCDLDCGYRIKRSIGLKHCQIYEQPEVIRDIAQWFHKRAAVPDLL